MTGAVTFKKKARLNEKTHLPPPRPPRPPLYFLSPFLAGASRAHSPLTVAVTPGPLTFSFSIPAAATALPASTPHRAAPATDLGT